MKVETVKSSHTPLWRGMAPILAGLAFGLAPMFAIAQDDSQADGQEAEDTADVERMVVTGSRLQTNANIMAPNPVLSVGEGEIESRGITRIEDLTNDLPQVFAGNTVEASNDATGTATLDLRGLGPIRTLALIDGRRLPLGSAQASQTDRAAAANIDIVPTALIERVEVVTGGASAVYGSDAIAGVVNFILKDDYEGMEIDLMGGFNQASNDRALFEDVLRSNGLEPPGSNIDGRNLNVSLTMGANTPDGRGNVTMFFNYENLNEISQADRVESACALGSDTGGPGGLGCVGSSNFRRFGGTGRSGAFFQEEDGTIVPFESGPDTTFNFGPFNFFQRPVERYQAYVKGRYEIAEDLGFAQGLELFADFSFTNNTSDAQIAPSATFGTGVWEINCDNPMIQGNAGVPLTEVFGCVPGEDGTIPDTVSGVTASHRNVEGGPRNTSLSLTTYRTIGGLRGTLFDEFDFEMFGQFSRVLDTDINEEFTVDGRAQEAFLVEEDENGNLVCQGDNPNCAPYNIFQRGPNGESLVSDEAVDFVYGPQIFNGQVDQIVFGGDIQTNLSRFGIQSPFADDGPGILFGGEYRQDELTSTPDQASQQGDFGFPADLPVAGEVRVAEFFTETQIPLISGAPLIEQFAVGGAYRFSDYTAEDANVENTFDTDTWHLFANWTPVESVRLRGQFQRAVRAPNVIELFSNTETDDPQLSPGPNGLADPCAGENPFASFEACAATGMTEEQFGTVDDVISGQTTGIIGGNTELLPEESDTWTFGAVLTPGFAPGLSVSVDWFNVQVDDAIASGIEAQTILDNCIQTQDPQFCDLITRNPNGSLQGGPPGVGFLQTNLNIATLETTGVDFQVIYDLDLWDVGLEDFGSVRFDYASTYLDELKTTPFPGGDPVDCAGKFLGECTIPNPEYRHRLLTTWQTPWDLSITSTWRYFSSTDNQVGEVLPPTDRRIGTTQYLDLSANWFATDTLSFRAGINNVFETDIPVITAGGPNTLGNGNTFPGVFDTGRFFFFGATYRL